MSDRIVECVPNFSEGRDVNIINSIVAEIKSVKHIKVLHVDSGVSANRTVVSFIGSPEAVVEAGFLAVKKAAELIDMRTHKGEHPRQGATDVLPIVPISGISLDECAMLARNLAKRVYEDLGIATYCYEESALVPEHRNLAFCRQGEYEGLEKKLSDKILRPDFAPETFTHVLEKSGATTIGARKFLLAVNFNLNTDSVTLANEIAVRVREKGRKALDEQAMPVKDKDGKQVWIAGRLKACKAIAWYIEEYSFAQVSMNITDIDVCKLYMAYEEVKKEAAARNLQVRGTEIIGLVPKQVLLDVAGYILSESISLSDHSYDERDLIQLASEYLNLSDISPFNIEERVLEYLM